MEGNVRVAQVFCLLSVGCQGGREGDEGGGGGGGGGVGGGGDGRNCLLVVEDRESEGLCGGEEGGGRGAVQLVAEG